MVIDTNYVVKIDPSIDLPHASFLSCGFSTGFGSAWREANVEKGSSVAVIGLGAVGLGVLQINNFLLLFFPFWSLIFLKLFLRTSQ
jgi:S-(hydroxymethyl)glutathione dehydrogenase/alcohol dehydrogenase